MGDIAKEVIYQGFIKENHQITSEGIALNGVKYFTAYSDADYYVTDDYYPSEEFLKKRVSQIQYEYIPNLGLDSFQSFIAKELKTALLVTRNLTPLFNTSLMYEDKRGCFYETFYLDKKDLKEILLPLFNIDKTCSTGYNKKYYYLSFKEELIKK